MDISKYRFDQSKTQDGVWVELEPGVRFKIASLNSRNFEIKLAELMKPYRNPAMRHKLDEQNLMLDIRITAMAEAVVLDWEGITNNGVTLPYSVESAREILMQSPEIRKWIEDEAGKREHFLQAVKEAATENLKSGAGLASPMGGERAIPDRAVPDHRTDAPEPPIQA